MTSDGGPWWAAEGAARSASSLAAAVGKEATVPTHADALAVIAGLPDGLSVVERIDGTSNYRFVSTNPAFAAVTGATDVAGKPCDQVLPAFDASVRGVFDRVIATGEPWRFVADDETQGAVRRIDAYAFRVGDADRGRVAVQLIDVTQRLRRDEAVRSRLGEMSTIVDHAPLGVFLVDADVRLLHVNAFARGGATVDVDALIGRDFVALLRASPNENTERVVDAFLSVARTGEPVEFHEFPSIGPDGAPTFVDWRLNRVRLHDGSHAVVCYFTDVTRHVEARGALAASEARYRTLFERIEEGFCVVDVLFDDAGRPADCRIVEANPAFVRLTGTTDVAGRTFKELNPQVDAVWLDAYADVVRTGMPLRTVDRSTATDRWYELSAFPIDPAHAHRVAALFNDVTARQRAEAVLRRNLETLHHDAHHDALTGLPNRVLFEDRLELAVAEAARHRRRLAVLFVDLDGFKGVNDVHGHAAGDAALVEVAARLSRTLRESDTLARLHGDEFVVLLPEIAADADARALAATLRDAVAPPIDVGGRRATLTASIGVCVYPRDARDAAGLLRVADAAMYRAKAGGKNAVADGHAEDRAEGGLQSGR
jgi:diguanylate cyclase (GGDEF)-like protein/PAS domain S-box-containing protein